MNAYQKLVSVFLSVCLLLSGCASYQTRQMPIYLAEEAAYVKEVPEASLKIGVQPLLTEAQQKAFFEDEIDGDVLPVLLILDNQGKQSNRIPAGSIELVTAQGETIQPLPFDVVYRKYFKKTVWARVVAGFIGGAAIAVVTLFILLPAVIILPVFSAINTSDVNKTIRTDLLSKMLHNELTATAGRTVQGLVFFPHKTKKGVAGTTLRLGQIISYDRNNEPLSVEISLG